VRVLSFGATIEKEWVSLSGPEYERVTDDGDDELAWNHSASDTKITLFLSQPLHPLAAFEFTARQSRLRAQLATCELRAIEKVSQIDFEKIRRLLRDPRLVMLSDDLGTIFWALPQRAPAQTIADLDQLMMAHGFDVKKVTSQDRDKIVNWIDISAPKGRPFLNSTESEITTPIWLPDRQYHLLRELYHTGTPSIDVLGALVTLKVDYENRHGYDFLKGKDTTAIEASEILGYLFDIQSMRGTRMIDIGVQDDKILLYMRVRETSLRSAGDAVPEYLSDLDELVTKVSAAST